VDSVIEDGQLAILAGDISTVLEDLGMPPTPGIPQDSRKASDVLVPVDIILECLWEAYTSSHGPCD
jgi:hypothetical protein